MALFGRRQAMTAGESDWHDWGGESLPVVVYVDSSAEGRIRFSAFLPGRFQVVAVHAFEDAMELLAHQDVHAVVGCIEDLAPQAMLEQLARDFPTTDVHLVARPVDIDAVGRKLLEFAR